MTNLVRKEDKNFIDRFFAIYRNLNEENQNLVLAFLLGMEFQHELTAQGQASQMAATRTG